MADELCLALEVFRATERLKLKAVGEGSIDTGRTQCSGAEHIIAGGVQLRDGPNELNEERIQRVRNEDTHWRCEIHCKQPHHTSQTSLEQCITNPRTSRLLISTTHIDSMYIFNIMVKENFFTILSKLVREIEKS